MARPKGSPNKATANAREAIAKLVEGNVGRLEGWLDEIAADERHGPLAAYRCFMDVIEYHIPKLARTELSGPNGGPQQHEHEWTVNLVRAKPLDT
jgi:hypothetical protein